MKITFSKAYVIIPRWSHSQLFLLTILNLIVVEENFASCILMCLLHNTLENMDIECMG